MAISGSMTTAYECKVQGFILETVRSKVWPSNECERVTDAVDKLAKGETVTMAVSDMAQLRKTLEELGIGG